MRIALTGASGQVGRFIAAAAHAAGHQVVALGRTAPGPTGPFPPDGPNGFLIGTFRPFDLAQTAPPDLSDCDALVHCALAHLPGRYRGGEGDDPAGFSALNGAGTARLFAGAKAAGVARCVFLSSRAVYDGWTGDPDTPLLETCNVAPSTLYGLVKRDGEHALQALNDPAFVAASLRATGVYGQYGPGTMHKWSGLFADFVAGRHISPRNGTEVHGHDLAQAVLCLLDAPAGQIGGRAFNAGDILVDRHDLLAAVAALTGCSHAVPDPDPTRVADMSSAALCALGWRPGGQALLARSLPGMVAAALDGAR